MNDQPSLNTARRRAVLSSLAGNALEFYDTTAYAFFTIYFAHHFFPSGDEQTSLISAYALFGLSYLARPFGGVIVSTYADKIGRKPLIVILMFAMAFSTGAIGLLPTYTQVGILAPLLLVFVRLIQAIAVGAVFSSTTAFLMEFAPEGKRGFYASVQMMAQALSPVLANLIALSLLYVVGKEELTNTWWRLPFILGFLTAPLGLYIHKFVDESPAFAAHIKNAQEKRAKAANVKQLTLLETLSQRVYVRQILCCIGIIMVGTVSFFGVVIYLPSYIKNALSLSENERAWLALLAPSFATIGVIIGGYLSDKMPRVRMMQIGVSLYAIAFFGFFAYLEVAGANYGGALLGISIIGLTMGLHWAAVPILLSESYPIQIRATAMAVAYNGAVVLFGAMTPTYLGLLEKMLGKTPYNPLVYIGVSVIISFVASRYWRPASQLPAFNAND